MPISDVFSIFMSLFWIQISVFILDQFLVWVTIFSRTQKFWRNIFETDPCYHPIDLLSKYWSQTSSPLVKMGRLVIPKNSVLYKVDTCENFMFDICDGIQDHTPIGKFARTSCALYESLSSFQMETHRELQKVYPAAQYPRSLCAAEH